MPRRALGHLHHAAENDRAQPQRLRVHGPITCREGQRRGLFHRLSDGQSRCRNEQRPHARRGRGKGFDLQPVRALFGSLPDLRPHVSPNDARRRDRGGDGRRRHRPGNPGLWRRPKRVSLLSGKLQQGPPIRSAGPQPGLAHAAAADPA